MKVKIFFRRATKNYLPTFANIAFKKIIKSSACGRCQAHEEDTYHPLVGYKYARFGSFLALQLLTNIKKGMNFLSFGTFVADQLPKSELKLLVMISWSIWNSRSSFLFAGKCKDPHYIIKRA